MPRKPKKPAKQRIVNAIPRRRANPRIDLKTGKRGAARPKTHPKLPTDPIEMPGNYRTSRTPRKRPTPIPTIKPAKRRAPNVKNRNRANRNKKA